MTLTPDQYLLLSLAIAAALIGILSVALDRLEK